MKRFAPLVALLAGCAAAPATPVAPPVQPGGSTPAPVVMGPNGNVAAFDLVSADACAGGQVAIRGYNYGGVARWEAWLQRSSPRWIPGMPWEGDGAFPYAVKLGEVPATGDRQWAAAFDLKPTMGPMSTGGDLTVEAGTEYRILLLGTGPDDARVADAQVRFTACPAASPAAAPALAFAAPIMCVGEDLVLTGTGFAPGEVLVTAEAWATRLGGVENEVGTATVAADGTFTFTIPLRAQPPGFVVNSGMDVRVFAYDQHRSRATGKLFRTCDGGR